MQKVLITGASSGIGRAVAERLVARGDAVFASGRSEEKLALLEATGFLAADLTQPGAVEKLLTTANESLGGLDCVVHCTGIGLIKPSLETTDAEFTRVMNVNTRTTFLVAREAVRVMAPQKRGLFLTFPGILGKAVMKNASAYSASKFAVTGLIKAFAQEHQRAGMRFGLFFLGGVDTPFWDPIPMAVQREKMIPVATAADLVLQAIDAPPHLVLSEVVLQPESHQIV